MTSPATMPPAPKPQSEKQRAARPGQSWLGPALQLTLAILATAAALVFLLWPPSNPSNPPVLETPNSEEAATAIGPYLLKVKAGTPLEAKLAVAPVSREKISAPMVKVTGAIVARLPAGSQSAEGRWDFNAPELAGAYADWLKARADVPFNEKELATIRELTVAKVSAQTKVVDRLENLVRAGTDPLKDLDAAKADLLQAKLQGQKDEHEALTALQNAVRTLSTLERQLFQAGIDPELLVRATPKTAIVVAEVPEARIGLIRQGQACVASFYAFPDTAFSGRVGSLAPTLSKEQRTLRVFFELDDPQGRLKPGMFADIGLDTDVRESLLVPLDGVIHVGRLDYMLVAVERGIWRVTEVKVGEVYGGRVEALAGLKPQDHVLGAGAILLKPFIIDAIQGAAKPTSEWPSESNHAAQAERRGP